MRDDTERLGDLETLVLYGHASPAEIAEYRQLADEHEARVKASPEYLAFCEATAIKLGADVAEFTALATEPTRHAREDDHS